MTDSPAISILICTRNRADSLRLTLRSLAACDPPPPGVSAEVVVIDNNSTDHTPQIVAEAAGQRGPAAVRYLFAGNGGQAAARNAGLAASAGRAVLFTDDDVRLPAGYLMGMAGPILAGDADVLCGGVRLAPHLLRDWMTPTHRSWLASTEQTRPENGEIVGANMAFGRHVLSKVPGFDEQLGPGARGFRDDTLFGWQLHRAGFRFADQRAVEVEHHFDPARLTRASFLNSAKNHGRSTVYFIRHYQQFKRSWPRARYGKARFDLLLYRIMHRSSADEVPSVRELELAIAEAFWLEYMEEERSVVVEDQPKR